jgi:endonuclease YncB( thermonuclease family)
MKPLTLAFFLLLATVANAQTVTVTDGDTIHVGGTIYRLWGIDAPELRQKCPDGFPAGLMATAKLFEMIRRPVVCEDRGKDRYARTIGLCRGDGLDLSAEMVRQGWALAFVRYSRDYVDQEREAREAKRGLHEHDCIPPWEWRAHSK